MFYEIHQNFSDIWSTAWSNIIVATPKMVDLDIRTDLDFCLKQDIDIQAKCFSYVFRKHH